MKKYLPGLFALVLAVAMSAFTVTTDQKKAATGQQFFWYELPTATGHNDPDNYSTEEVMGCDESGTVRCKILATPDQNDPSIPDLTQPMSVLTYKD